MTDSEKSLKSVFNQFISGDSVHFKRIASGLIHTTYVVTTNRKSYLLQKMNTVVFPLPEAVMINTVKITDHLGEKPDYPYKVVGPFKTLDRKGFLYMSETGTVWRLFPFSHGITYERTSDPDLVFKAALAIANFIFFLDDMDPYSLEITIPGFHDPAIRWHQFKTSILSADPARLNSAAGLIETLKLHEGIYKEFASLNLPTRVVHNDAKLSNILFDQSSKEPIAVIDLDTAMPGSVLCDFGDMVRTMATNVSEEGDNKDDIAINQEMFRAIWAGFCQGLSALLTDIERKNLFHGAAYIILEQTGRFLSDYLSGDKYYRVKYPQQNLDRAINQYILFESLISRKNNLLKV
jgi:serine/threonine protein kinase